MIRETYAPVILGGEGDGKVSRLSRCSASDRASESERTEIKRSEKKEGISERIGPASGYARQPGSSVQRKSSLGKQKRNKRRKR